MAKTKKKIDKPRKLTIKQKKFLKEYFKTGNATKSAMAVYDVKDIHSARAIGGENLSKLREVTIALMEAKGLSLGKIIDKVNEATDANKIITSHTEPDYEVPDHPTRLKAIEIVARWLRMEQPANINIQGEKILVIPGELMGKYEIAQDSGDSS